MADNDSTLNYQDILDKYAESLKNPASTPSPEPETTKELPPPTPSPVLPPPLPPEVPSITPPVNPPEENHFFKYLFYFSFFIFLIVLGSVVYSFLNSQKSLFNKSATPTTVIPTAAIPSSVCQINGQEYQSGQSFTATDGCNTCTCQLDGTFTCTDQICTSTPTKSATTSASSKQLKTYSSAIYGFSFQYPSKTKIIGDINSHIFGLNMDSEVISVLIISNPKKLPPSDFFLQLIDSQNPDSLKDYVKFSTATFNNQLFTNVIQDPTFFKQQSGAPNHYLISSKNYIINFSYFNSPDNIKQILSTFKLL